MRLQATEYAPPYARYIQHVREEDFVAAMEAQSAETQKLLSSVDEARASWRYDEGKWSIKEVIGHLIDAERVFSYRALAFSRREAAALPSWDENEYVKNGAWDSWSIGDLKEEFALLRRANVLLFRNLPEEAWERAGIASGNRVTVRALAAITVGHERHHVAVLRERYGL